jgi:predicted acylesterase/phospholipase RssA
MRSPLRNHRGKTALVLAGGGLSGAMYEIGALRAIDDILTDRTVNDFDIYVGTSAGAIVCALLANGATPEMMLQGLSGDLPGIRPIQRRDLFQLNVQDVLKLGIKLPRTLLGAWTHYLRYITDITLFDLLWSVSEALPTGMYDSLALEAYMREIISNFGGTNHFTKLRQELHIVATDLDSGKRAVFGPGSNQDVPISLSIAASTAVPLLYRPVRIADHDYVDGSVRGNASVDLAVERGANLVIVINPLVPFDNSDRRSVPFIGPDGSYLSDKGLTGVAQQVGRIQSHGGLIYHIKQLRKTHPEVDIVLIEPNQRDYQMTFSNIMRYSTRLMLARHGFETVTLNLAENYAFFDTLLSRHGIPITEALVDEELEALRGADDKPNVLRRILERRPPQLKRSAKPATVTESLSNLSDTLDDLDAILSDWPNRPSRQAARTLPADIIGARTPARSLE